LVKKVYKILSSFPKEEMYGLTSQMKRAAVSVPNCAKTPISLVGHGFSRANTLTINYFANLKVNPMECETIPSRVCPTLKNPGFGTAL